MSDVLQQNLGEKAQEPGTVFIVHLLMEEPCEMPNKEWMQEIMTKHLGDIDCFFHDENSAGFAVKRCLSEFKDASVPQNLFVTGCVKLEKPLMNAIEESQLWDCPNGTEILQKCQYHVIATDMLSAGLYYQDRAEMLVDYIEALVEMFPVCKAVVCDLSKKMFTREDILHCNMPKNRKFIQYAVNVRFFNIQGTEDSIVDTIGMSTLFIPDLQFHFHGMNPDWVVNYADNVLTYMYDRENPIQNGDHIDGIRDGRVSMEEQWEVRHEESLIQPVREVIDVFMNEFASGGR